MKILSISLFVGIATIGINAVTTETAVADGYVTKFQFLYDQCKLNSDFCLGYISGVGTMMFMNGYIRQRAFASCAPDNLGPSNDAMIQAVLNFGQQHPEYWSDNMFVATNQALSITWPCK